MLRPLLLSVACAALACDRPPAQQTAALESATLTSDAAPSRVDRRSGTFETVEVPDDLPAYVVRGRPARQLVFLGGMCVHPAGYIQSFPRAAAARGTILGLQGDRPCGGALRSWGSDLAALDRRIEAAFAAAGMGPPADVIVIGYSQGAERAEQLVTRYPARYTRAVLIASPTTPNAAQLARAKAVVTMAGSNDIALARMRRAADAVERAGGRAAFFEIAGAYHGQMGDDAEATMRPALDFVD